MARRLQGGRRQAHRGAARRSVGRRRQHVQPASGRLRQCRRPRCGTEADRRLRAFGCRLSREASRQRRRCRRSRQPQGQGGCGRVARHHPVLLRQRALPALSRGGPRARHLGADHPGHRADPQFQAGRGICRTLRRHHAVMDGAALRRARQRSADHPSGGRRRGRRAGHGPGRSGHPPVPLLHAEPGRSGLRHLPSARAAARADTVRRPPRRRSAHDTRATHRRAEEGGRRRASCSSTAPWAP